MKPNSKIPGIVMIVSGLALCVVEEFMIGVIILIAGLYFTLIPQPAPKKNQKTPSTEKKQSTPVKKAKKTVVSVAAAPAVDAYAYNGTCADYFDALLRNCFPEYTVHRNVTVHSLTNGAPAKKTWKCACGTKNTGKFCAECGMPMPVPNNWTCSCGVKNTGKFCAECGKMRPIPMTPTHEGREVSFALYKDNTPKCAIILAHKNLWMAPDVYEAMQDCSHAGIPCLRFYEEFRNEAGYVVDRIRKALR